MEVQYKIMVPHHLHIRPTVAQLTGYLIQHYVWTERLFLYKNISKILQWRGQHRIAIQIVNTHQEGRNAKINQRSTVRMCLIVIRCTSHTSWCRICQYLLIWKWFRLRKVCKLQRGIRKPLLEWQTIQLLIENGTKRQHAT